MARRWNGIGVQGAGHALRLVALALCAAAVAGCAGSRRVAAENDRLRAQVRSGQPAPNRNTTVAEVVGLWRERELAGRRVVPELIQDAFTPDAVAQEAIDILTNDARASRMRADLRDVRQRLGTAGASRRAAAAVLDVARARSGCVG